MNVLSENLKALRERAGYSIRKLSEISGVGKSTISEIESGKAKNPRYDTLVKLANTLNVSAETLTDMEVEHEYIITDVEEALNILLSQENLTLDGISLTTEAKMQLKNTMKMGLQFAREIQDKSK